MTRPADKLYVHARTVPPEAPFVQDVAGRDFCDLPRYSWKDLDAVLKEQGARYVHQAGAADVKGLRTYVWKNTPDDPAEAVVLQMDLDRREGKLYFASQRALPVVVSVGGSFTALCHNGRMYYAPQRLQRFGFHHLEPMAVSRAAMANFAFSCAADLCA